MTSIGIKSSGAVLVFTAHGERVHLFTSQGTRFSLFLIRSREYSCTEASCTPNEAASACRNALVCMANFSVCEQSWFASCTAQPEPSAVGPSKWEPAKASATQVGSACAYRISRQHVHIFYFEANHIVIWCGTLRQPRLVHGLPWRKCIPGFMFVKQYKLKSRNIPTSRVLQRTARHSRNIHHSASSVWMWNVCQRVENVGFHCLRSIPTPSPQPAPMLTDDERERLTPVSITSQHPSLTTPSDNMDSDSRMLVYISKSTWCSSATNVTNSRVSRFNRWEDKKTWIFYLKFCFLKLPKDFFLPYFSLAFFKFSENFLKIELNFTN